MSGWEGDAEHPSLALLLDSTADTQSYGVRTKHKFEGRYFCRATINTVN